VITASTPAKAAPARTSVGRATSRASSATTKKGTAAIANCLSVIAAARNPAATTYRDRVRNANASTTQSRLGASALPNQAARIAIGFAAAAAASGSFHASGAGKSSTATNNPSVASKTNTR
jgi:hypothetical protein